MNQVTSNQICQRACKVNLRYILSLFFQFKRNTSRKEYIASILTFFAITLGAFYVFTPVLSYLLPEILTQSHGIGAFGGQIISVVFVTITGILGIWVHLAIVFNRIYNTGIKPWLFLLAFASIITINIEKVGIPYTMLDHFLMNVPYIISIGFHVLLAIVPSKA